MINLVYLIKLIGRDRSPGYISIADDYDGTIAAYFFKKKPKAGVKLQNYCAVRGGMIHVPAVSVLPRQGGQIKE